MQEDWAPICMRHNPNPRENIFLFPYIISLREGSELRGTMKS
jgi:hypothetical protein